MDSDRQPTLPSWLRRSFALLLVSDQDWTMHDLISRCFPLPSFQILSIQTCGHEHDLCSRFHCAQFGPRGGRLSAEFVLRILEASFSFSLCPLKTMSRKIMSCQQCWSIRETYRIRKTNAQRNPSLKVTLEVGVL